MSLKNGREIIRAGARAQIVLPLVFRTGFDYRVPDHMELAIGDWVFVPFGKKSVWGVVWGLGTSEIEEHKIKNIERVCAGVSRMSDAMRSFIDWVSWYTLAPKGMVLKMVLSSPDALEATTQELRYVLTGNENKPTPARQRIMAYLSDSIPRSAKEISLHAKVSSAIVRDFIKLGGLKPVSEVQLEKPAPEQELVIPNPPALSPDQQAAAGALRGKLDAGFSVSVLDGVTGSGKTEVYFDTIAACIEKGKQALILLPEISLSIQWLGRFEKRFGFVPHVWHSNIAPAKKRNTWRAIVSGEAKAVVGARSVLFLPFLKLGLVVVDEEHDASYKQEEGVIYQARDMAVARASQEKIPAVLVSATPSLETEHNIARNRYRRLHLPDRHGGASMPQVRLIDMRREKLAPGNWLSEPLRQALMATVASKRQAMLFMNRRGYAPLMLCRSCGHRFQCPHCTAWLVLHRSRGRLVCHHCGHMAPVPKECPECKNENSLIPFGPGVERVTEEARALLPEARIEVMTSDHVDSPEKADALIQAMMSGEIDILVGTQMIAKGHHFSGLALVGVVDADMGLGGGDLRTSERTYQLLHQLSGRAGREATPGVALLQTYMPEHPVMEAMAAGDRDRFMQLEAQMREEAAMPPYGKLASVIIEGDNEQVVAAFAREIVKGHAGDMVSTEPMVLGPAPAPIALLRGKYRYRILVKSGRNFSLQPFLANWLLNKKIPSSIRIKIDVDPYSFI